MSANKKRSRSDSVAVHVLSKKLKQPSPEADKSASEEKEQSVVPQGEELESAKTFVYTTPATDAQSPVIHLYFFSDEIEWRQVAKAWPRAAVREIWARIRDLPEDEQEGKLEELDCIETFPLVQVKHCDEDVENSEGENMYDIAIQAMKGVNDEHSGWQDVVLQKEQPRGGVPALELVLVGESQGVEDPGRPYHGRWWWISSQPASAEDELAIAKLDAASLSERTGLWMPEGDDEGSEGAEAAEEDDV